MFVPESPKYLYSKGKYDDARTSIAYIARFNGISKLRADDIVFDKEIVKMDIKEMQSTHLRTG